MEAGPENRARVSATGAGLATENRGLVMLVHVAVVILIVGLIVGYLVIDV